MSVMMTVIFIIPSDKCPWNNCSGPSHYLWYILNCNFKQIKMEEVVHLSKCVFSL